MSYNATIVSMTDAAGTTGNADYSDCRMPTDDDLLEMTKKYGLTKDIKVTITSVVGVKTRLLIDIIDGKVVQRKEVRRNLTQLEQMRILVTNKEIEYLSQYKDYNFNTPEILESLNLNEEDIWREVEARRGGKWFGVPDRFKDAMFNCIVADIATDRRINGTI